MRLKHKLTKTGIYISMAFYALTILLPLYLMLVTSFKSNVEVFTNSFGFPASLDFSAYVKLFTVSNYGTYFYNSILVTVVALFMVILFSALASYALAKYQFGMKRFLYIFFVMGLVVPIKLGTIDIMKTMIDIKLFDTLPALMIVYIAMGIPFGVFILYDYIRMIPNELSNAARIDGCSEPGIFVRIIIPLLKPGLAAVGIINFIPVWNEFWFPLVLIQNKSLRTIPLATGQLFGQFETSYSMVFAVLTLATVPVVLIYLALSRYFIKGLSAGAVKG